MLFVRRRFALIAVSAAAIVAAAAVRPDLAATGSSEQTGGLPKVDPFEAFAYFESQPSPDALLKKWRELAADITRDRAILGRCRIDAQTCPPAAQRFLDVVQAAHEKSGRALIGTVNRAVNLAIQSTSDLAQHGVEDRWSAPIDTFASGRGDCEDYAIAKYVALTEIGVAKEDVRLLIVRNIHARTDHALLAVRHEDRWLLLDNRHFALVDAAEATDFVAFAALDVESPARMAEPPLPTTVDMSASPIWAKLQSWPVRYSG